MSSTSVTIYRIYNNVIIVNIPVIKQVSIVTLYLLLLPTLRPHIFHDLVALNTATDTNDINPI